MKTLIFSLLKGQFFFVAASLFFWAAPQRVEVPQVPAPQPLELKELKQEIEKLEAQNKEFEKLIPEKK